MLGFMCYNTEEKTISGIEAMNMISKGQVEGERSVLFEVIFVYGIFGVAA